MNNEQNNYIDQKTREILTFYNDAEIEGKHLTIDEVAGNFPKTERNAIKTIIKEKLVKADNYLEPLDNNTKTNYKITELGKMHLPSNNTNITTGDYSNISYNSPNTTQAVNIEGLDNETRKLILELNKAAIDKNGAKLKQAFGLIVDKSIDVAIALATGVLLK